MIEKRAGYMGISHRTDHFVYYISGYHVVVTTAEGASIFKGLIDDLPTEHLNILLDAEIIKFTF